VLAPAALFALIRGLPPRRSLQTGAAFGVGLFTFGTYWLYTCLHGFGLVPVWLTLLLQTVLVAAMSLYVAAVCYVSNRFWLKPGATRVQLSEPAAFCRRSNQRCVLRPRCTCRLSAVTPPASYAKP